MDDNMRLCEAQLFLSANRHNDDISGENLDLLAAELSQRQSLHPLWSPLLRGRASANRDFGIPEAFDGDWGPLSHRRVAGPSLEVVFYTDAKRISGGRVQQERLETGIIVLLRGSPDNMYEVAALQSYHPPEPGWPPASGEPMDIVDR